jgi:hypothetical protein
MSITESPQAFNASINEFLATDAGLLTAGMLPGLHG